MQLTNNVRIPQVPLGAYARAKYEAQKVGKTPRDWALDVLYASYCDPIPGGRVCVPSTFRDPVQNQLRRTVFDGQCCDWDGKPGSCRGRRICQGLASHVVGRPPVFARLWLRRTMDDRPRVQVSGRQQAAPMPFTFIVRLYGAVRASAQPLFMPSMSLPELQRSAQHVRDASPYASQPSHGFVCRRLLRRR